MTTFDLNGGARGEKRTPSGTLRVRNCPTNAGESADFSVVHAFVESDKPT